MPLARAYRRSSSAWETINDPFAIPAKRIAIMVLARGCVNRPRRERGQRRLGSQPGGLALPRQPWQHDRSGKCSRVAIATEARRRPERTERDDRARPAVSCRRTDHGTAHGSSDAVALKLFTRTSATLDAWPGVGRRASTSWQAPAPARPPAGASGVRADRKA